MFYQINHTDKHKQQPTQVHVSDFNNLLKKVLLSEKMIRSSTRLLKIHKVPKILNIGGISFELENIKETDSVIENLEYALENYIKNN